MFDETKQVISSYDAAVEKAESEAVMKKLDEGSVSVISSFRCRMFMSLPYELLSK